MTDEPPDKIDWITWLVWGIAAVLIALTIFINLARRAEARPVLVDRNFFDTSVEWWESLPSQIVFPTLAMITSSHNLEDKIPACESDGDPNACNKKYGCIGGMGLWGFISRTWNSTIDRMAEDGAYFPERCRQKVYLPVSEEKTEAVFDPICNDLAGRWLLKTDGTRHWGTADTWWGSYDCFMK